MRSIINFYFGGKYLMQAQMKVFFTLFIVLFVLNAIWFDNIVVLVVAVIFGMIGNLCQMLVYTLRDIEKIVGK